MKSFSCEHNCFLCIRRASNIIHKCKEQWKKPLRNKWKEVCGMKQKKQSSLTLLIFFLQTSLTPRKLENKPKFFGMLIWPRVQPICWLQKQSHHLTFEVSRKLRSLNIWKFGEFVTQKKIIATEYSLLIILIFVFGRNFIC